jgi:hypothetical protein
MDVMNSRGSANSRLADLAGYLYAVIFLFEVRVILGLFTHLFNV